MARSLSRSGTAQGKVAKSARPKVTSNQVITGTGEMTELNQRETNLLNTLKVSKYSHKELQSLLADATKDNRLDFADGIQEIIDQQYPQLVENSTSENDKGYSATFKGKTRDFGKVVHAYIWLIESMIDHLPSAPEVLLNDHVFQQTVAHGKRGARYFAQSPEALFPSDSERSGDPRKSHRLKNGWFINLNLSTEQKDERLFALANACALHQGIDWSWTAVSDAQISLDELLASFGLLPKRTGNPDETNSR